MKKCGVNVGWKELSEVSCGACFGLGTLGSTQAIDFAVAEERVYYSTSTSSTQKRP